MLVLVPIPYSHVDKTRNVWLPFVDKIAQRSGVDAADVIVPIEHGDVHIHLAWEPVQKRAHAACGTRVRLRAGHRIAELEWATGSERKHWLPLLEQLEKYHRETLQCVGIRAPFARIGWARDLKERGYRVTHCILEKDFLP